MTQKLREMGAGSLMVNDSLCRRGQQTCSQKDRASGVGRDYEFTAGVLQVPQDANALSLTLDCRVLASDPVLSPRQVCASFCPRIPTLLVPKRAL